MLQRLRSFILISLLLSTLALLPVSPGLATNGPTLDNPILFVTQIPVRPDFTTIGSTFGNQLAGTGEATRGGDLWIRYPDGTLRNLTEAAGYGMQGFQGDQAIAVRDPSVHWDGEKAVFSMVIGGVTEQYEIESYNWQLYEVSGFLDPNGPITITKVPNQPENYNNIYPIYASDDSLIFVSDRPRSGEAHLYPQLDEYELAPTNTGLWKLDPQSGALRLLNHAPSGDFTPTIDSYGRLIFTQWDHLQRDQQADADAGYEGGNNDCGADTSYGTFNYADETAGAARLESRDEVFPEPRDCRTDLLAGTNLSGNSFNQFMPWQINQDGSEGELINHIGRHELRLYIDTARTDDPEVIEFYSQYGDLYNQNPLYTGMFQIKEDPLRPGTYYGVDAPEFGSHASGQIVSLTAPPEIDADHIAITYVTHRDTYGTTDTPDHSGHYREPLPLADGTLAAIHTSAKSEEANSDPSIYDFRLKTLKLSGEYYVPDQALTGGISETISYWDPDNWVEYSGYLWELNPVEVRPRTRPNSAPEGLQAPEMQMFTQAGVTPSALQNWLETNGLALLVSRDVTRRDDLDKQQPFNLRIPGGVQTTTGQGTIYDIAFLQFFQADQLRGFTGCCDEEPRPGRRVLAQPMHAPTYNPPTSGPQGSVVLAADGSMAAFVPAQRALTWQLTDPAGVGVVRERYWLTFQPGEMRVCANCHGLSLNDQVGQTTPTNPPQALLELLEYWKDLGSAPQYRLFLPLTRR